MATRWRRGGSAGTTAVAVIREAQLGAFRNGGGQADLPHRASSSTEAGDDGKVGRGNRVNGLITPHGPMTMEAAAGKNPVNLVGKLYHVVANRIATIVAKISEAAAAMCTRVSRIGAPIEPAIVDVTIATIASDRIRRRIEDIVRAV